MSTNTIDMEYGKPLIVDTNIRDIVVDVQPLLNSLLEVSDFYRYYKLLDGTIRHILLMQECTSSECEINEDVSFSLLYMMRDIFLNMHMYSENKEPTK